MSDILYALGVAIGVVVAGSVIASAMVLRALVRANRVVAARRSAAPLSWLWSWRRAPRLHRRLRRAAGSAQGAVASLGARRAGKSDVTALHQVAADLTSRAVLVDDWLVAASRLHPLFSSPRLGELSAAVRDLEASAYRLQQVSSQWRLSLDRAVQATAVAPPDLRERLDAVEAALHELPTGV